MMRQMAASQYRVVVLKDWSKDGLAAKIAETLEPYAPEEIVSIYPQVDFQWPWPWRRNWAMIVLKTLEPGD